VINWVRGSQVERFLARRLATAARRRKLGDGGIQPACLAKARSSRLAQCSMIMTSSLASGRDLLIPNPSRLPPANAAPRAGRCRWDGDGVKPLASLAPGPARRRARAGRRPGRRPTTDLGGT
jgi:hypothetical protein